jgi:hypothetical protein
LDEDVQIMCRPQGFVMDEAQTNFEFTREFQVTLRASDPRFVRYLETLYDAPFGARETFSINDVVDGEGNIIGDALSQSWSYDFGQGTVHVANSELVPEATGITAQLYRTNLPPQADWRVSVGQTPFTTAINNRAILKRLDATNYIMALRTSTTLRIVAVEDGLATDVVSLTIPAPTAGVKEWISGVIQGNTVVAERYVVDPGLGGAVATHATAPTLLTGARATKFGTGVLGGTGFIVDAVNLGDRWDDITIEPLSLSQGASSFVIRNHGNFESLPFVRLYGPMTNPVIYNNTTGQQFALVGTIPANDHYEIDFVKRTVKNADGESRYSQVPITAEFFGLIPQHIGDNDISVSASSTLGFSPAVRFHHRDTWI